MAGIEAAPRQSATFGNGRKIYAVIKSKGTCPSGLVILENLEVSERTSMILPSSFSLPMLIFLTTRLAPSLRSCARALPRSWATCRIIRDRLA
jgi:hypothetical protein